MFCLPSVVFDLVFNYVCVLCLLSALLRVEPAFFLYRSGVYRTFQRGGARAAYHSVRIIGWGEEVTANGAVPYWVRYSSTAIHILRLFAIVNVKQVT